MSVGDSHYIHFITDTVSHWVQLCPVSYMSCVLVSLFDSVGMYGALVVVHTADSGPTHSWCSPHSVAVYTVLHCVRPAHSGHNTGDTVLPLALLTHTLTLLMVLVYPHIHILVVSSL